MPNPALPPIVIAGGGSAGWMAAATLARFSGRQITLVESDAIGTVGVGEATIPQIRLFNAALGIDEGTFLRETKGTFKLAIAFDGWAGEGESYLHAFGPVGHPSGVLPFQHYWLRAHANGEAGPLADYCLNDVASRAGKMQFFPAQPGKPAPDLPWAYHFDAGLYAAMLRSYSEERGVRRIEGAIASAERSGETGDIAALILEDGTRVEGGFFLDCTGFRSLLVGEELGVAFEDWSHWLPCDTAVAVPCAPGGDFAPYTRSIARKAGWQWRIPLQHRIGNGHVFCSDFTSVDEATATLLAGLDGSPGSEPRVLRFTTGMRTRQWEGNCLALGLAAGFMEPLESTSIHLIQSSISRLLQMLPGSEIAPAVRDEFNRQARFEWERIRDFLILHYVANGRAGEPFWDRCRAMDIPETLGAKIAMFRASGNIHREHEELFTDQGWLQVFIGQGIMPEHYNPIADRMPASELSAMLERIASRNRQTAHSMADHAGFLHAVIEHSQRKSA